MKITQNLQVKPEQEFSQAWCFLLEDEHPLSLKEQHQRCIPGFPSTSNEIVVYPQAQILRDVGGLVLANACGPCIGQWDR